MTSRSMISSPKSVSNCEHAMFLESSLLQLRDTALMSDVTIVCGSQTFKAHKIILVASSGYFYNIFTNKLKKDVKHLAMTDITAEILKIILDYIYTGLLNVNRFMKINQEALIRALHHLDMADVYRHRLHLMMKSLAPNYYSELWSLADIYQMKDMSTEIAKYISQNLELCMLNRHFVNLTLPQLIAILSSENIRNQSETLTLEAIQKWVLHDISRRERFAINLLSVAKVTVSAKTKAIASYDSELQNFLMAPNRKKFASPNSKKDKIKKMTFKEADRSIQAPVTSVRSDKTEKEIRSWRKKPAKIDDINSNKLTDNSLPNYDYNSQHGDYHIEDDEKNEKQSEETMDFFTNFVAAKLKAERDIDRLEREIATLSPISTIKSDEPNGNEDENSRMIYIDDRNNRPKLYTNTGGLQTTLLPPSAITGDLRLKCKKPIRVHSIQLDPDVCDDQTMKKEQHQDNSGQFSEERVQIMKLKTKLNSIINRIRYSLKKNSKTPSYPTSDDGSSICSKQSDALFGDNESIQDDYQTTPILPSGAYSQYIPDIHSSPMKLTENNEKSNKNHMDSIVLTLNVDEPSFIQTTPTCDTFRASEKQTNTQPQNEQPISETNIKKSRQSKSSISKSNSKNWDDGGSSIILKRPTATSNESLISPEEVRSRLEKFKKLMHTTCRSPVDVEKINLKGSRSFIISGNEVDSDMMDNMSDHCDLLSDISEADTFLESSSNDECIESQTEWFRTLSTIPEETSICDCNGSSHTEIELKSEKGDSPFKFVDKNKLNWNIKDNNNFMHLDNDNNCNFLSKSELNDLGKNVTNNIFCYESSDPYTDDNLINNIEIQQGLLLNNSNDTDYMKKLQTNFHLDSNRTKWQSINNNSNRENVTNIGDLVETNRFSSKNYSFPDVPALCKLKVFGSSNNRDNLKETIAISSSSNVNPKKSFDDTGLGSKNLSSKKTSISMGVSEFDSADHERLEELQQNRLNNIFEFGGYQCFAAKSSPEESETTRSNDTLNITLENLVTPTHNKFKSMPVANDIWKLWKTKLEASCKPSPRPIGKPTFQPEKLLIQAEKSPKQAERLPTQVEKTDLTTLSSIYSQNINQNLTVESLETTKSISTNCDSDELRKALNKRISSKTPQNRIIFPTPPLSLPELSLQVSPLSSAASQQISRPSADSLSIASPSQVSQLTLQASSSPCKDDLQRSFSISGPSTASSYPTLELGALTSKDDDSINLTGRTHIIRHNYESRNYLQLNECPLQDTRTEKVTYGTTNANNNINYRVPSSSNSEQSLDGSICDTSNMKMIAQTDITVDEGPVLILLATNKHNEASQQVYCLRKRCWLPQRKLLMPPIENNYSVGFFEGNVYYIGGLANGSFRKTNSVFVYRSAEHTLVSAADLLVARVGSGVANLNSKIYVAGGIGRYHKPIAQVERYDTKADRWHLVAALRIARTNVCLVTSGKLLFAIGGTVSADSVHEVVSKACESYDSEIDQWSLLVELPSHFLMTNPLVTSVDNKLYAVRLSKPDVVYRFHTRKNKWLPIQNTKLTASKVCCILPGERKLYAVELAGKNIHSFDMHAFQWEVETQFPAGLHWQAAAFVVGLDEDM